jgi:hypothetical protein
METMTGVDASDSEGDEKKQKLHILNSKKKIEMK